VGNYGKGKGDPKKQNLGEGRSKGAILDTRNQGERTKKKEGISLLIQGEEDKGRVN